MRIFERTEIFVELLQEEKYFSNKVFRYNKAHILLRVSFLFCLMIFEGNEIE